MYHNSNLPDPFHTRVNGCTVNQRPTPNSNCNQNTACSPPCNEQPVCKEKPVCKEAPICKQDPVCKEQPTPKKACVQEPPKDTCAQNCSVQNERAETQLQGSCCCTTGSNRNQLPFLLLILCLSGVI